MILSRKIPETLVFSMILKFQYRKINKSAATNISSSRKNFKLKFSQYFLSQPAFTCSKSTIETLEQGVKYVQS